jgi:hypothetical protein
MALNVGTRLARRDPQGDGFDLVQIVGLSDLAELGSEVIIKPAVEFASPLACTRESLLAVYTLDVGGPEPVDWTTPEAELHE